MNEEQYYLVTLMEELTEMQLCISKMQQEASKCIRFGIHETHPVRDNDNIAQLNIEYTDMLLIIERLNKLGVNIEVQQDHLVRKDVDTEIFMKWAQANGRVDLVTAMISKRLLLFLKKEGVFAAFHTNLRMGPHVGPVDSITDAFSWGCAPEGYDYWCALHQKYYKEDLVEN